MSEVCIIGGGASGLMAAISAAQADSDRQTAGFSADVAVPLAMSR